MTRQTAGTPQPLWRRRTRWGLARMTAWYLLQLVLPVLGLLGLLGLLVDGAYLVVALARRRRVGGLALVLVVAY